MLTEKDSEALNSSKVGDIVKLEDGRTIELRYSDGSVFTCWMCALSAENGCLKSGRRGNNPLRCGSIQCYYVSVNI